MRRDCKQITFDLDQRSVLYWRRALLLRYYLDLGNNENTSIEWLDFDTKSVLLEIHDEESPFQEKLPVATLNKTIIQIKCQDVKIITITLYYTTCRVLVQSNECQSWVVTEFENIKKIVNSNVHSKGGNSKHLTKKERNYILSNCQISKLQLVVILTLKIKKQKYCVRNFNLI